MASQLDIIIPVYNEAENLSALVKRLDTALTGAEIEYSLIAIDDHSSDRSVSILKRLAKKYPLTVVTKDGPRGKAFSILQGSKISDAPYIAMIDADLQYPPEVLPDMLRLTQEFGVVVAQRQDFHAPWFRRVLSRGFQWVFGKLLYGLDCDIQSGLKVFKRDIIENVGADQVTAWTLDIPLLTTALDLGYKIGHVDITFAKRTKGESKINLVTSIREIGGQAISYRLKRKDPFVISPEDQSTMVGAGIIHRGKRFVTHTTLHSQYSALHVITAAQKMTLLVLLGTLLISLLFAPFTALKVFVAILSTIYFVDVLFNLYVLLKSLHTPPEIHIPEKELKKYKDKDLPVYTVLCPLYKEAHVLPQFVANISKMKWPKRKLDVMLLLEADDTETIEAARSMKLPSYISIHVVPNSQPKTKPKACNYGLQFARGEFLVIYDAEDDPDPLQLKKVYAAFQQVPENVKCIQAKLNFYNPHQNLLTRFFTAEYSLWFDVVLTGLQSINTTIPLGGTSNHFRTADLKALEGWDPFNVTEDCDLGIRLFKRGALTAVIDSVTLEEANSRWGNWLRQRSRWIKGYMQTYLVHMRNPVRFAKEYGWHSLMFQLVVGGKIAFMLINPFMWLLTVSYFALYAWLGPAIEALYPSIVFYMAVSSLLFGNFMFIYYYMIGAAKREHWSVIKWVFLVPVYWLLVSVAACIALYELMVKPHYWQKTVHGLHLKKKAVQKEAKEVAKIAVAEVVSQSIVSQRFRAHPNFRFKERIKTFQSILKTIEPKRKFTTIFSGLFNKEYRSGLSLVAATIAAHALNMATNIYLGARLSLQDFGQITTFMSLFYLVSLPLSAFSLTINHRTSILLSRHRRATLGDFWMYWAVRAALLSIPLTLLWLLIAPLTIHSLQLPFLMILGFTPFVLFGLLRAVNEGYLYGKLVFGWIAAITLIEPIIRLLSSVLLGEANLHSLVFLSIPLSTMAAVVLSLWMSNDKKENRVEIREFHLPFMFFLLSLVASLASITFFSLDNVLVAHFMQPEDVGRYGLLGLIGKSVFFAGSLSTSFIIPLVSHNEGRSEKSTQLFRKLFLLTGALSIGAYAVLCLGIPYLAPTLGGAKLLSIAPYLPVYGLGILGFTLGQAIVQYHLAKQEYSFASVSFFFAAIQMLSLFFFHDSLSQVVMVMSGIGSISLVFLLLLHWQYDLFKRPLSNINDFFDLFERLPKQTRSIESKETYRVLILNWRDTRHRWSGGAETYIHEVAKELIRRGHQVTLFCGNDGRSPRNEVVDDIQVVRRGGFYSVYLWAFLYYVFRFRKNTDFVIDSANGIPFLTPLYVRQPIFLLIHHIHQEVFHKHLIFPLSEIAALIECDIMPFLYQSHRVITVSDSSKKEIIGLGLGNKESIQVINPGITPDLFTRRAKTKHPSVVYIGRLKQYKNLPVALEAFAQILPDFPNAVFTIGGSGDVWSELKALAKQLKIEKSVKFIHHPSNQEKITLFAESWVAVQPSMIEGWGITVIEANAAGTPVIASNVKGLKDSVQHGETGVLVKPLDADALAAALRQLLTDAATRKKMSTAARTWAKRFSWEISTDLLLTNFSQATRHNEITATQTNPSEV